MNRLKKFFLIAICLYAGSATAAAAPAPSNLIANIPGRTSINLNGTWRAIVDPYEVGTGMRFYENAKPKTPRDLVEYNFDTSSILNVPDDWNSQRPELFFYEGSVWYKKSFSYHKRGHSRVFVYFGAANYRTSVYLNAQKLGDHEGGFTPFNFEATNQIREGDNFLVVEVNSKRKLENVPSAVTDFWNYGGLTRDVSLVELPETFIRDYWVQLAKGSLNEIEGWVKLNGASSPQQVTLEISEAGLEQVITTDDKGYGHFHVPANLKLWSPENPKLYQVTLSAAGDSISDQIGFRSVETRGSKIFLNGKPIFLQGISLHEEAPFRGGRAFSEEDDRTLLTWAKELGCNFVRLAHYPHNETMIRLADRLGLLVWSEIPVYWETAWENPATLQNAQEQLRDVIARDHNRAAVVLWSVANETPVNSARLAFLQSLVQQARTLDPTRLITAALNHFERPSPNTIALTDPLAQSLDVVGLNEYLGWYGNEHPEDCDHIQWTLPNEKPLIVSEFGGGAPFGNHGDSDTRWTEEYQANLYEHQLNMLKRIPSLAGISPWVLMDFHSPRRLLPGIQDYRNRKGLISDQGERKQAFYVLQRFYRDMKEAAY
ncbi:MAG: glycoside hydrolase family 2 TIM barrel-domain containing protein [Terriglobales bacterium]|jgi:beta-glucuronidase